MIKRIFLIVFLLLSTSLYGEIIFYLNPRVPVAREIKIRNIAVIEGAGITKEMLDSVIPASIYKDGYIDQREIQILVEKITGKTPVVYGSAVKIDFSTKKINAEEKDRIIVKRNDPLKLIMRRGRIRIEFSGKALSDSVKGQIIKVRVRNNKKLKAKIISSGRGIIVQ